MEISIQGKHALVTGAGKGIGRGIAKALWSAGAETYAFSRTQADLDSLQEECPGIHVTCIDLAANWDKTAAAVANVGQVDLLVNNAGVIRCRDLFGIAEEDYEMIINTNLKSVLNVSQVVARGMVEREQGGAIVNISSIFARIGGTVTMLYNLSKGALDQLTRCMAVELGPHQIRVNAILPNLIPETPMGTYVHENDLPKSVQAQKKRTPLGRFGEVQEVIDATLYLLSDKADMINGAFLAVDGGFLCT